MALVEEIRSWAAPLLTGEGYELVEIEYVREGKEWFLRFFIDKPGGVGLADCELASNALSEELDRRDPIPRSYRLEVSSPGLERPLKGEEDLRKHVGRMVQVTTYAPVEGKRGFTAKLMGLKGEELLLLEGTREIRVPFQQVALVRLAVEF